MFQSSDPTKKKFNALRRIIDNPLSRKVFFFFCNASQKEHTYQNQKEKKKKKKTFLCGYGIK